MSRYLKQEISAPASPTGKPSRFTSVSWHPEQALQIVLTTHSMYILVNAESDLKII